MELDIPRLHALPPELFDMILTEVFTAPHGARHLGLLPSRRHADYNKELSVKHSIDLLHVSRATRAIYAATYYGAGEFVFRRSMYHDCVDVAIEKLVRFIHMLSNSHQELLRKAVLLDWELPLCVNDAMRLLQVDSIKTAISQQLGSVLSQKVYVRDNDTCYGCVV